jgi:hypothetical protein
MIKEYVKHKRDEIIWSVSEQDYSLADIGMMFNLSKTQIHNIISSKPADWKSPWVKRRHLKVNYVCPK